MRDAPGEALHRWPWWVGVGCITGGPPAPVWAPQKRWEFPLKGGPGEDWGVSAILKGEPALLQQSGPPPSIDLLMAWRPPRGAPRGPGVPDSAGASGSPMHASHAGSCPGQWGAQSFQIKPWL